jgi:hypothetical protein
MIMYIDVKILEKQELKSVMSGQEIAGDLVSALHYIHSHRILHRYC